LMSSLMHLETHLRTLIYPLMKFQFPSRKRSYPGGSFAM